MKIFVINLLQAENRREHIKSQLEKFNIEYEIFNAIDANTGCYYWDHFYSNTLRLLCYARPLTKSQVGCFASHYKLWQKCIELNEPIVVLEDDIELTSDFDVKVNFLETKISKYGYIRLWGIFQRDSEMVEDGIKLYKRGPAGTQGYVILPNMAKKFISKASRWIEPVDDYMDKYWIHGVIPYCVVPEAVYCLDEFDSSIAVNKYKSNPLLKMLRELFKLQHLIRKNLFDLKRRLSLFSKI